jgi:hypothetical protein
MPRFGMEAMGPLASAGRSGNGPRVPVIGAIRNALRFVISSAG